MSPDRKAAKATPFLATSSSSVLLFAEQPKVRTPSLRRSRRLSRRPEKDRVGATKSSTRRSATLSGSMRSTLVRRVSRSLRSFATRLRSKRTRCSPRMATCISTRRSYFWSGFRGYVGTLMSASQAGMASVRWCFRVVGRWITNASKDTRRESKLATAPGRQKPTGHTSISEPLHRVRTPQGMMGSSRPITLLAVTAPP